MMEAWFTMVIRQLMLYSLPVLITFSSVMMLEHTLRNKQEDFRPELFSGHIWLPLLASIAFGRALIFFLFPRHGIGLKPAVIRCAAHAALCLLGWLLYTWALAHPPLSGLPPLHHWWAKVLMYLNLCLVVLHLLPFPGMVMGEWLKQRGYAQLYFSLLHAMPAVYVIALAVLAASPLPDMLLGGTMVFPVYELLASLAA